MSIIRIEDVKKLRFGPGERVDCKMGQGVGTRWCPGTIVALHYRENDWETGYCAAYQVRLDRGSLIFSPDDSPGNVRASAAAPAPNLVLTDREGEVHPSPPLGYIDSDCPAVYKAHRLVEMLCAPAESFGVMCDQLRLLSRSGLMQGAPFLGPATMERIVDGMNSAGMQALVVWGGLNALLHQHRGEVFHAVLRRPLTLSMLSQWLAHTPNFGPLEPDGPEYMVGVYTSLVEKRQWRYTGDYKDPNDVKAMRGGTVVLPEGGVPAPAPLCLSPPQFSGTYMRGMCVAIENLYILTDPKQARLGATPGRLLASSPHFPALLRRLVEITVRFREPQMSHPLTSRSMSDLTLSALRRLVATQPRARWLLRSPGFELQWSRAGGVWEPAPGEKTLRWILNYIDSVSAPYITPAAKKEARKVLALLDGFAAEAAAHSAESRASPATRFDDIDQAFDAVIDSVPEASEGCIPGVPSADSLTDELAGCRSDAEREWATTWLLDSVLLPSGRVVQLNGLASRPDLNGKAGVVDGPRRGSRYPVRLLASGTDGWLEAPLLIKPASLRLLQSPAAAVQEESRAGRRIRREARALTRRENRRLDQRSERADMCIRLSPDARRQRLAGPERPPRSLVRGGVYLVRGVGGPSGHVVEVVGWDPDMDEYICRFLETRYGGKQPPSFVTVPVSLPTLIPGRFLMPVLARPGPILHEPPGRRGPHWKVHVLEDNGTRPSCIQPNPATLREWRQSTGRWVVQMASSGVRRELPPSQLVLMGDVLPFAVDGVSVPAALWHAPGVAPIPPSEDEDSEVDEVASDASSAYADSGRRSEHGSGDSVETMSDASDGEETDGDDSDDGEEEEEEEEEDEDDDDEEDWAPDPQRMMAELMAEAMAMAMQSRGPLAPRPRRRPPERGAHDYSHDDGVCPVHGVHHAHSDEEEEDDGICPVHGVRHGHSDEEEEDDDHGGGGGFGPGFPFPTHLTMPTGSLFPGIPREVFEAVAQQMGFLPRPYDGPTPASRVAVSLLPRRAWSATRNGGQGVAEACRCVVCMDDFADGEEVMTLPCFHFFHTPCAERWLKESGICPICKHEVD